MTFPAADALDIIHNQLVSRLQLHKFDAPTRTKTRLFAVGGPTGKQFALIVGDLDPGTLRPVSGKTIIVLPKGSEPHIDGILDLKKDYKTSRLQNADSKIPSPDNRGFEIADGTALLALLQWYANA